MCVNKINSKLVYIQLIDWRLEFSKWWSSEFKTIKISSSGTVFNYYIDPGKKQFRPWSDMVLPFELNPDIPLQVIVIPTLC